MRLNFFREALMVIVLGLAIEGYSQDYFETALLFSRTQPGGSARIQGLGGAQTALGGDYSSAASNPAGLGMFNRSEFTLSAGLLNNTISSTYLGTRTNDNRTAFNVPGVSLVLHLPKEKGQFLGGAFAITLSRVNNFNSSRLIGGNNPDNSIVDYFIDQANGRTTTQFDEGALNFNSPTGLAYFNYLIGPQSSLPEPGPNDVYFTDVGFPVRPAGEAVGQQEENLTRGATNQWNFSYGGNIADRFFFGAGVGVTSLRYRSGKSFIERYDNPDIISLMQLNESLEIRGSGVNATLGAIARPVNFFQVGVSYTTPTIYSLSETYEATMGTRWNNYEYYLPDGNVLLGDNTNDPIGTDLITSDYSLQVPSRFTTGVALISKIGFVTADVEFTNPGNAKYSSQTFGLSYTEENRDISEAYRSVVNYRVGAEYRFDSYRARLGYGVQANPYRGGLQAENTIITMSAGLGMRLESFYIDFAVIHNRAKKYFYQPYTFGDGSGPFAELTGRMFSGIITAGFTF